MSKYTDIAVQAAVYIIFLLLAAIGSKKRESLPTDKEALSELNGLRGFFALEVIVGHVVRYENNLLFPFGKFMIVSVGFFFYVSGFGLAYSLKNKEHYLNGRYILSKPVFLAAAALIVFLHYVITGLVSGVQLKFVRPDVLKCFFSSTNWYIKEQILFYLLFFLIFLFLKKRAGIIALFAATSAMVLFFYYSGMSEAWVASSFCFPLGVFVGDEFDKIKKYLYGIPGIVLSILLTAFGLMTLFVREENIFTMVVLRNMLCVGIVLGITALCGVVRLCYNKPVKLLCAVSTELYLFQFVWLELAGVVWEDYRIRLLFVLILTIAMAALFHPLFKKMRAVFGGRA